MYREIYRKGFSHIFPQAESLPAEAVSGTTELADKRIECTGLSPFMVCMLEDVSADVGSSASAYSGLTSFKPENSKGQQLTHDGSDYQYALPYWNGRTTKMGGHSQMFRQIPV